MTAAELIVKIAVGGAEAAAKSLQGVEKGLSGIRDTSLATKIALGAVFAAAERLTGHASQMGMELHKFTELTGLGIKPLQEWEHAFNKFDVGAQETQSSIMGLQKAFTGAALGEGLSPAMQMVAGKTGMDFKKASQDSFYALSKLQEFAKTTPASVASKVLGDLGLSEKMIVALKMINLERDKGSEKDYFTPSQVSKLTKINEQWKELWWTLDHLNGKIVAEFGGGFIASLLKSVELLQDAGSGILALTDRFEEFRLVIIAIGAALALYFAPLTTTVAAALGALSEFQKAREGKDNIFSQVNKGVGLEDRDGGYHMTGSLLQNAAALNPTVRYLSELTGKLADTFHKDSKPDINIETHIHGNADKQVVDDAHDKIAREIAIR